MPAAPGERILFSETDIAKRVCDIAHAIAAAPVRPDIAVPVLTGAFVFAADLVRALAREGLDLEIECIWLRAYGAAEAAGAVRVLQGPNDIVRGRDVLLIDGVLESGATLARAHELLTAMGAAAIASAVVLVKQHPQPRHRADFAAFQAGTDFVYGYGMDRAGRGRGLPDIRTRIS